MCPLRLYPANPGRVVRRGCVSLDWDFSCAPPLLAGSLGCACLCARSACTPPFLAGLCCVGVCVWAPVSAAPRLSWLGCSGMCVCVRAPLVPRHSWLGCAVWVCVLGLRFWPRPATPGWEVAVCVCCCVRSACFPPLLAGVCGASVCVSVRVSAAPRRSWLGCSGLFVLGCALRFYPASPGLGVRCGCVCVSLVFSCAPPLLAGVLGSLCVCVRAPPVPRHFWPGCALWVCVLGFGFRLRPATPGWGVGVCVCSCVRSACTPPLLAGVCGVVVCLWARVLAVPRQCWLGCWGLCAFVCALLLHPATPGWGKRCGCVCSGSGFGCAPPLLAVVLGCVCFCAIFACTTPLLAWVCGGWVCCCLAPVPVPWFVARCAPCPGLRHPLAVVAWHLPVCLGYGRRLASLACLLAPCWCAAPL